jgi:hypothetical protein
MPSYAAARKVRAEPQIAAADGNFTNEINGFSPVDAGPIDPIRGDATSDVRAGLALAAAGPVTFGVPVQSAFAFWSSSLSNVRIKQCTIPLPLKSRRF